ncbi:MAG: hypothetical protein JKY11_07255 [Alphaproteobacteria bacterium]|nr:hypothetical protein [Alphaproteobacteria bacterium]
MKEELKDLLEQLGVGYILNGYQTHPCSYMDHDAGQTCSGEVRMGPDEDEFEVELQMMYDTPPEGKRSLEQLMYMIGKKQSDGKWDIKVLKIKNEDKKDSISGWVVKACKLFRTCTKKMMADEMPDFDDLLGSIFKESSKFGGSTGQGGGKQPKIRPGQLLDMKQGAGF